jgi:hypothetical protein
MMESTSAPIKRRECSMGQFFDAGAGRHPEEFLDKALRDAYSMMRGFMVFPARIVPGGP